MAKEWSITTRAGRDQNGTMYYLLTANNSGNTRMYPCASTTISIQVNGPGDYTFFFRCHNSETDIHISALNDVNGSMRLGRDHAADFAAITNAV